MFYLELVSTKNQFNLTKIIVLKLFRMVTNQSAPNLNRSLPQNFGLLRNANHVKFTEEWMICTEKDVLVKKSL